MKLFTRILFTLLLVAAVGLWILSTQGIYRASVSARKRMVTFVIAQGELTMMWFASDDAASFSTGGMQASPAAALDSLGGMNKAGFRWGKGIAIGGKETGWIGCPLWLPTLLFALITWKKWRKSRLEEAKSEPVKNLQPQPQPHPGAAPAPR